MKVKKNQTEFYAPKDFYVGGREAAHAPLRARGRGPGHRALHGAVPGQVPQSRPGHGRPPLPHLPREARQGAGGARGRRLPRGGAGGGLRRRGLPGGAPRGVHAGPRRQRPGGPLPRARGPGNGFSRQIDGAAGCMMKIKPILTTTTLDCL
ncbi:unnamed protein product [Heterosigma akashiwo]